MIIFLWLCLLASVSCEILINHGDKLKFITTVRETHENIEVLIEQDLASTYSNQKNVDTGVQVNLVIPSIPSKEETIGLYRITIGKDGKNYVFYYATTNDTTRDETGDQIKDSSGIESLQVKGTYSYKSPGGYAYIQGYTADKNGLRTKVSFGKNVQIGGFILLSLAQEPPEEAKGKRIDSTILCTLVGGGCKK